MFPYIFDIGMILDPDYSVIQGILLKSFGLIGNWVQIWFKFSPINVRLRERIVERGKLSNRKWLHHAFD